MTIVGVVGTVKQYGLDIDGRIVVYRPTANMLQYQVARTASEPTAVAAAMVREIHAVDPTIPVYDVRTMTDRMSRFDGASAFRDDHAGSVRRRSR